MSGVREMGAAFQGRFSTVNMLEAKTNLSKIVEAVESGREKEVIIARNGKPAARIVPLAPPRPSILGIAKGEFEYNLTQEEFDADNEEIAKLFYGEDE